MSEAMQLAPSEMGNDFSYRPVPPLAVMTLVTGVLSLSGMLTEFALPFAVIGCVLGFFSLRQFAQFPTEFSGRLLALGGMLLSALCLFGGSALHAYIYVNEVPSGYQRLNFNEDISKRGFVETEGKVDFQEDVKLLDGQKVLLKGYMYPEKDTVGIRRFLLVKDSGDCCFGGQPKLTDMVHVVLNKDVSSATLRIGLVSVSGVFHLKDMRRAGNLNPVYEIEATHFGASKKIY